MEKATFGAGCFWGVQAAIDRLKGIISSTAGFMGGAVDNPSYDQVCTGETGHAEVVHLVYDPGVISYPELLDTFWDIHNPTLLNQQGADTGSQYRSVIFYHNGKQKEMALESMKREQASGRHEGKIATAVERAGTFYPAGEEHQKYLQRKNLGRY